jgi:8-oxo-dGTP pyrophosphatase MutT (NUDIX family)
MVADNGLVDELVDESALPVRLAGRVIAIDPAERVLLFYYDDAPPKGKHWSTPGGGVEAGEDFRAAARRELFEETGWADVPVSPGEVLVNSNVQWSYLEGKPTLCLQHDHYFVGRVPDEERPLGPVAAMHASDGIVAHRWWTLTELDETAEDVYPPGLADLVRRLRQLLTASLTVHWTRRAELPARGLRISCPPARRRTPWR